MYVLVHIIWLLLVALLAGRQSCTKIHFVTDNEALLPFGQSPTFSWPQLKTCSPRSNVSVYLSACLTFVVVNEIL